jgi:hypothetical protein
MGRVVAVPALVLEARCGVQVDDDVQPVPGADVDSAVEEPKPLVLEMPGPIVVLEVPVVDGHPNTVEAQ